MTRREGIQADRRLGFATPTTIGILLCALTAGCAQDDGSPLPSSVMSPSTSPSPVEALSDITVADFLTDNTSAAVAAIQEDFLVDVEVVTRSYNPHHEMLDSQLDSGTGAPNAVAIGGLLIRRYADRSEDFVDLRGLGADEIEDLFLPWQWAEGIGSDGESVIAIPREVSGFGLCYRPDLLEGAGLPSERGAVADATETWEDFIAFGNRYTTETGRPFLDSPLRLAYLMMTQDGSGRVFHAEDGSLDLDHIRPAFMRALDTIQTGMSDGPGMWSEEWEEGFASDAFAADLCPGWILRQIRQHVTDTDDDFSGQWDIAELPGPGGNWGGSFWAIPKQGTEDEQRAAWAFISHAIREDVQLASAEPTRWESGFLPSHVKALADPIVAEATVEFFNDAPAGLLLPAAALGYSSPIAYGPGYTEIVDALNQTLTEVDTGVLSSEHAWAVFVARAEEAYRDATT